MVDSVTTSANSGTSYTWASNDGGTWQNAGYSWANAAPTSFSVLVDVPFSISDAARFSLAKALADSFAIVGNNYSVNVGKNNSSSLSVTDAFDDVVSFNRNFAELVSCVDSASLSFSKSLADSFAIFSVSANQIGKNLSSSFGLTDSARFSFSKELAETLVSSDSASFSVGLRLSEAFSLASSQEDVVSFVRDFSESVTTTDAAPTFSMVARYSETLSASDSASFSFSLSLSDSWSISDSLTLNVGKSLAENFAIADSLNFSVGLALSESLTTSDAIRFSVAKSLAENLSLADSARFSFAKQLEDSFGLTDGYLRFERAYQLSPEVTVVTIRQETFVYTWENAAFAWNSAEAGVETWNSATKADNEIRVATIQNTTEQFTRTVTFVRNFEELASLSDGVRFSLTKALAESFSTTDSVSFSVNFSRTFNEALSVAEVVSFSVSKALNEALGLLDSATLSVSKNVSETIALLDSASFNVSANYAESLNFADSHSLSFTKALAEAFAVSETVDFSFIKRFSEAFGIGDVATFSVVVNLAESVLFASSYANTVGLNKSEAFSIADDDFFSFAKNISESATVTDTVANTANFDRNFAEAFSLSDSAQISFSKAISESFNLASAYRSSVGLNKAESLSLVDSATFTATFVRTFASALSVSDSARFSFSKAISEAVTFADVLLRKSNAVISDIEYLASEFDLLDFTAKFQTGTPAGFSNFVSFMEGDHDYQKAIFRAALRAEGGSSARLTKLATTVDVPDVFDGGVVSVPPEGIEVSFGRQFNSIPEVNVSLKGGTGFAIPRVEGVITSSSFFVRVYDASNVAVAAIVSWKAQGY